MKKSRCHPDAAVEEKAGTDHTDGCGKAKKRRRIFSKQKLLIGHRVEIRRDDDGFCGSWYSGRVTSFNYRMRGVEYDHILTEDGSRKLVDVVEVSAAVDGFMSDDFYDSDCCTRGFIRPLPPFFVFGPWDLHYGLCVDVFYNDGWWEGVVFDHKDGADYRKVFFPDLGDEQTTTCGSGNIRVTQDWNEKEDSWKSRGRWVFLKAIEECEEEWPLVVSVKQIWYDLREKDEFRNFEWTCTDKLLWEKLVAEVISDNLNIAAAAIIPLLHSPGDSEIDHSKHELPVSEKNVAVHLRTSNGGLDLVVKKSETILESPVNCCVETAKSPLGEVSSSEPEPLNDPSVVANAGSAMVDVSSNSCVCVDHAIQTAKRLLEERSSVEPQQATNAHDLGSVESKMIGVGSSTNIVDEKGNSFALEVAKRLLEEESRLVPKLTRSFSTMRNVESTTVNVTPNMNISSQREDSFCVGYESLVREPTATCTSSFTYSNRKNAESTEEHSQNWKPCNMYFKAKFNPDSVRDYVKKIFDESYSSGIRSVRQHLVSLGWRMDCQRSDIHIRFRYISPEGKRYYSLGPLCRDLLKNAKELSHVMPEDKSQRFPSSLGGPIVPSHPEESQRKEHDSLSKDLSPTLPVYSPEAVIDYYNLNLKDRQDTHTHRIRQKRMNAKKHLAAIGWTFSQTEKRGRLVAVYISPNGRLFQSLLKACEFCIKGGLLLCPAAGGRGQLEHAENRNKRDVGLTRECSTLEDLSQENTSWSGICGHSSNIGAASHQNTGNWTSESLVAPKVEASRPARVVRSTKRVRKEVTRPNQANPKTLLSWLIDKSIMLPREKLSCRSDANSPSLAVGRAGRHGIKCGCCQTVFNLRTFISHAGITYSRPASRIFLGDGRSLLDCQLQALSGKGSSRFMKQSSSSRRIRHHKAENDYICSVCHCGGEILLCDECPSSFHKECIGLKEVPDGEWFCPSCCCIICNQRKFLQTIVGSTDGDILNCQRCERNYHIGCLRARGSDYLESVHQGPRYCSINCEKMSEDLGVLVEEAKIVGNDKLTWTLLKCPEREDASYDVSDLEAEAEIKSRLHLALDVMHECFETVKEPFTNSDLVEDVIFNRGSPLHRLNFRGFYTVLLEREDELITVATVRIYGKRVAEVPLVGTRFAYRRLGMCRILMNTLEKTLKELGVERLVLPAVPGGLNTWTTSFGFKQMSDSERMQFLSYTFLDFQGTIMCCKELQDGPPTVPLLPGGILPMDLMYYYKERERTKRCLVLEGTLMNLTGHNNSNGDSSNNKGNDNSDQGFSNTSEVVQADATEGNDIVDQEHAGRAASREANGANSLVHEADSGRKMMGKAGAESSLESPGHCSGRVKCYERRKRRG